MCLFFVFRLRFGHKNNCFGLACVNLKLQELWISRNIAIKDGNEARLREAEHRFVNALSLKGVYQRSAQILFWCRDVNSTLIDG